MLLEGPISWSRKKQSAIALSSIEAEYRGVVNVTNQCLWLQGILGECGFESEFSTISTVIIRAPFESIMIQLRDSELSTLRPICTT